MARKIFKTGNSEVSVQLDRERGQIIITLLDTPLPGVTDEFARQVADFYEEIAVS
jgi:hypothetical protein